MASSGKVVHLRLTRELEESIKIILNNSNDFETEQQFIRSCIKWRLQEEYSDLLLGILENE